MSIDHTSIMSASYVNAISNENNYYASRSRKNIPNGPAMMLLVSRLGLREFEYERHRIKEDGQKMTITTNDTPSSLVDKCVPTVVNHRY